MTKIKKKSTLKILKEEEPTFPIIQKADFKHIKFTPNQLTFFNSIKSNIVTVCTGPAGTAKTFIACYSALDHYAKGLCKKIVLFKPAVESGDALGFLPGTLQEKIAPFMESYISNMQKIIGKDNLRVLIDKGVIEMKSLSHIRGATEDDSFMMLDEAQNSDLRQMILFITRMGKDSRVVICGDTTQYDVSKRKRDLTTFTNVIMKDVPSFTDFKFEKNDIVRHPLLVKITDNYEKYKSDNNID